MKYFSWLIYSVFLFSTMSCSEKKEDEVNKVLLCAMDNLLTDSEFRYFLIGGKNYVAWVPDGYRNSDSVDVDGKSVAWRSMDSVEVCPSFVDAINIRFPEEHKLQLVSQAENERILRSNKNFPYSCWYFGGMRKYKNKYYLKGGFAVSTKAGIGADFIIEIKNNKCHVIEYHPAIL